MEDIRIIDPLGILYKYIEGSGLRFDSEFSKDPYNNNILMGFIHNMNENEMPEEVLDDVLKAKRYLSGDKSYVSNYNNIERYLFSHIISGNIKGIGLVFNSRLWNKNDMINVVPSREGIDKKIREFYPNAITFDIGYERLDWRKLFYGIISDFGSGANISEIYTFNNDAYKVAESLRFSPVIKSELK